MPAKSCSWACARRPATFPYECTDGGYFDWAPAGRASRCRRVDRASNLAVAEVGATLGDLPGPFRIHGSGSSSDGAALLANRGPGSARGSAFCTAGLIREVGLFVALLTAGRRLARRRSSAPPIDWCWAGRCCLNMPMFFLVFEQLRAILRGRRRQPSGRRGAAALRATGCHAADSDVTAIVRRSSVCALACSSPKGRESQTGCSTHDCSALLGADARSGAFDAAIRRRTLNASGSFDAWSRLSRHRFVRSRRLRSLRLPVYPRLRGARRRQQPARRLLRTGGRHPLEPAAAAADAPGFSPPLRSTSATAGASRS